jgi:hypothetical protein
MKVRTLALDLRVGGLGDNWMRLVGFYVAAGLRPHLRFNLAVPANLVRVARHVFADRLEISGNAEADAVVYTVLGLRDLIFPVAKGRRFASPYGRVVIHDSNRRKLKDWLNKLGLAVGDKTRLIFSPPWHSLDHYQGYAEVVVIPALRDISPAEFDAGLARDYSAIRGRLWDAPRSPEFKPPCGLEHRILIFPTGTSRQFVPLEWARAQLPEAVFAFFHKDPDLAMWRKAGMEVAVFFGEPGDMLSLSVAAKATASTDSFPSHFLQYCAPRLVVMLTELERHRVVSPAFGGQVVPSLAPCHPCLHMERKHFPLCQAGHPACLNWQSPAYARLLKDALAAAAQAKAGFPRFEASIQA